MTALRNLAKTIRSKNAGVDLVTFDIIFEEFAVYRAVCDSGVLTPESVAQLYQIDPSAITEFVTFDPAPAIKFTLRRTRPSGSPGDPDIFGSQQYAPLLDVEVPVGPHPGPGSDGAEPPPVPQSPAPSEQTK